MTINNYESIIEIDESIDFCAIIVSTWHLTVLYSFLIEEQQKNDKNLKGIIFISPQLKNGTEKYRIESNNLINLKNISVEYYYIKLSFLKVKDNFLSSIMCLAEKNKRNQANLYLFSSYEYIYNWINKINIINKRNIILTKIDDGIGSYLPKIKFYEYMETERTVYTLIKIVFKILIKDLIYLYLKIFGINFKKVFLYKKSFKGTLKTDLNVSNNIKQYLILVNNEKSINYQINQILLLKDYDIQYIEYEESLKFYDKLISEIRKVTNDKIYIKRHPNDNNLDFAKSIKLKYQNIEFIDGSEGIETLFLQVRPQIFFGGESTSFYTINSIFGHNNGYNYSLLTKQISYIDESFRLKSYRQYKQFSSDDSIIYLKRFEDIQRIKYENKKN